ncbi:MAG: hypothetical protein AAF411_17460 [Myxococcota bacterium]
MVRFVSGFLVASALWGAAAYAYLNGLLPLAEPELAAAPPVEKAAEEEEVREAPSMRRRRRRGRRTRRAASMQLGNGEVATGDDLGEGGPRELNADGTGGESQLSAAQIESEFDARFGGIQRCLVLVPPEETPRGRLTFGLRIAGSGRVTRVNLRGPASVTRSEAGDCLRRIARGMRFPTFDGPEMVTRYPITLE